MKRVVLAILCFGYWSFSTLAAPVFEIANHPEDSARLDELFQLHRVTGPDTTLWDPWLPMSLLWLDTTNAPSLNDLRQVYRERLLRRRIDAEGYVSSQQHEGLAHAEGWPFPLWTQAGGVGWHFTAKGVPYEVPSAIQSENSLSQWTLSGATTAKFDPNEGWTLSLTNRQATLLSPAFRLESAATPWLRLKWSAANLGPDALGWFEWLKEGETEFPADRRMVIPLPRGAGVEDVSLPHYRHPDSAGTWVRLRLSFDRVSPGAALTLQRVFTAVDSRHNINNAAYLQACDDYLRWTGDLDFLRRNLQRMRLALAWAIREFQLDEKEIVFTPWPGHDGRSGHVVGADGRRTLRPGVGVGNNYWDLLPFGGEDGLATIYYFDALRRMAALERQIQRNPSWNLPSGPLSFEPSELLELAESLRKTGNERLWNESTGRFAGWRDADAVAYDYGFTFLNNEAIYYGFASEEHARSIRDWIDGRRIVDRDTSTGADIYHWRFGPRATTRRNVETYFWGWSDPASIPWGGQVQDGGAVLGFSFHDLMARLEVNGPDDAWRRLRDILAWFGEVQQAGGYRKYYAQAGRGTLQGGGTAGGLGLDAEFFESAMVPQVMLYGFAGFRPRLDGCLVAPRLPKDWPAMTIRNVRLHDVTFDLTVEPSRVRLAVHGIPALPLRLFTPGGEDSKVALRDGLMEITTAR
ncbi:MAG: hypothetical protein IT581_13325 [Verrucomicrobiales bacterium]|nr:hypothetical protein [Verrucomicrobiales bacterium]